jgi:hypothetical protein
MHGVLAAVSALLIIGQLLDPERLVLVRIQLLLLLLLLIGHHQDQVPTFLRPVHPEAEAQQVGQQPAEVGQSFGQGPGLLITLFCWNSAT